MVREAIGACADNSCKHNLFVRLDDYRELELLKLTQLPEHTIRP
ncbi:hypothetical protein chiPu_0025820, partial [Chiloscyllium punctatum]|nr:hypothetical protein [Chiloscyllium punctatum]